MWLYVACDFKGLGATDYFGFVKPVGPDPMRSSAALLPALFPVLLFFVFVFLSFFFFFFFFNLVKYLLWCEVTF